MKRVLSKTVAYCPPECHTLWLITSSRFLQGSNDIQPNTMETYDDQGDDDAYWI